MSSVSTLAALGAVNVALSGPLFLVFRLLNGDRMLRNLPVGVPDKLLARRSSPFVDTTPGTQPFIDMLPLRSVVEALLCCCLFLLCDWP